MRSSEATAPAKIGADRQPSDDSRSHHRFRELDALRGIAALWVVVFHYTMGTGGFWLNKNYDAAHRLTIAIPNVEGLRAVDLFFIVSGFVIFMTIEGTATFSDFMISRVARLFPAYWFSVLTIAIIAVSFPEPAQSISLQQMLINLTMLQAYLGVPSIDPVFWSLAYELGFYFCMSLVLLSGAVRRIEFIGAAWVSLSFLVLKAFPDIGRLLPWRFQTLIALPYAALFFSGILFYRIRREGASAWRITLLILCFFEYIAFENLKFIAITTGTYVVFSLCATGKAKFLTWQPLTILGFISYALYLLHYSIGFRIQKLNFALGMAPAANFAAAIVFAIGIAWAVTLLIDRPGQRTIRRAFLRIRRPKPSDQGMVRFTE